ncbi:diguanylate cyclase [Geobacter sp. OR-1]|uniref:CZB domain-containing protein n=1 Tax=Geobacter sp. OR-1 TaxID=1266765 RepID=UPI00054212D1|nr:CZB domain-containing protein [Geobacter sp. OR-1]GAM10224.1 diguanylate cyclase [Geobacter sp. OR-1]
MNYAREINKAIANHGYWKVRLHDAIESGKSDWTPDQVGNDSLCEFGKWFYSLQAKEGYSEFWQKTKTLHERFHSNAAKILKMALTGHKEDALAIMRDMESEFVLTSIELTNTLNEWKKSVS